MKKFNRSLTVLLLYLILLLNLERIQLGGFQLMALQPVAYIWISIVVLLIVALPFFRRQAFTTLMISSTVAYLMVKFSVFRPLDVPAQMVVYGTFIEVVLLNLGVYLAYQLASDWLSLDTLIETIAMPSTRHAILDLYEDSNTIENEFNRARRYDYPITTLVIATDVNFKKDSIAYDNQIIKDIAESIKTRYVAAKLEKAIGNRIRQSDLLLRLDQVGRIAVVFTETSLENAQLLAERLQHSTRNELGFSFVYGIASFPEDALTFRAILSKAEGDLDKQNAVAEPRISHELREN